MLDHPDRARSDRKEDSTYSMQENEDSFFMSPRIRVLFLTDVVGWVGGPAVKHAAVRLFPKRLSSCRAALCNRFNFPPRQHGYTTCTPNTRMQSDLKGCLTGGKEDEVKPQLYCKAGLVLASICHAFGVQID